MCSTTASHQYTWDAEGRPVSIDGVSLTYDALGRMMEQNRSGSYTELVYGPDGGKLALMNGQTVQKGFVPLPGKDTTVYNSTGLDHYRHPDWLGSSRFASTPARGMYFDVAYAPFGEPYAQSGTTDLSFTGQNEDTAGGGLTGLYDFPAREYSTQGRWSSPDPAGLGSVSFETCVLRNANEATFGQHERLVDAVVATAGAAITNATKVDLPSGQVSLTANIALWASRMVYTALGGLVPGTAVIRPIANTIGLAGRAAPVAAAVEADLLIGSAINCR